MCSGQRRVGGLYLSALLLQQTAELQANKPRYHHRHQQQIRLQQLSAVHITTLTAQTCTYPESSALECLLLKNMWLFHCMLLKGRVTQMTKKRRIFSLLLVVVLENVFE